MDNNIDFYKSPETLVIDVETESIICISGDIDPTTEEDWYSD